MSADNGIYILKTRDNQYRIAHIAGVDCLFYSEINGYQNNNKFVPSRIIEKFGDCRFTRDEYKAYQIAHKWAEALSVCEYGVHTFLYNKSWKHILMDGKDYAKKEVDYLRRCKKNPDKMLQKIADGYYLNKWLEREEYYKRLNNENYEVKKDEI